MGHLIPQRLGAVDDVLQETASEKVPPGCCSQFLQTQGPMAAKAQQILLLKEALGSRQFPSGLGESWVH